MKPVLPPHRKVLAWHPPPRRRLLARIGLAVSTGICVIRICSLPWLWRYVPQGYVDLLWLLLVVPTMLLIAIDLRVEFPHGHCRKCGYNLTGNTSGICPECGEHVPAGLADPISRMSGTSPEHGEKI